MDLATVAEAVAVCPSWMLLVCDDPARQAREAREYFGELRRPTRLVTALRSLRRIREAKVGEVALVAVLGDPTVVAAELEALRSRMVAALPAACFFATDNDAKIIARFAPNFASFLRGGIAQLKATEETFGFRAERLEELRKAWQLADEDVISRAESGTLDPEPDFAVWLVLLNRSDLLVKFQDRRVKS